MKKIFRIFFLLLVAVVTTVQVNALNFEEALAQSKPMALLIYADWAENAQDTLTSFKAAEQKYSEKYNFVTLNIASADTKAFNKSYHIYPNLPYVLLFKDKGRISRYLKQDCITSDSCFSERLNLFIR